MSDSRGVYSSLQLYILPHPYFSNLDFLPQIFNAPSPLSHLVFFPTAMILEGEDISFQFPFVHVIYFPTPFILPSSLHNLIFFPYRLDEKPASTNAALHKHCTSPSPPPPWRWDKELHTPLCIKFLILGGGWVIKSFREEYQVLTGEREYFNIPVG